MYIVVCLYNFREFSVLIIIVHADYFLLFPVILYFTHKFYSPETSSKRQ